MNLHWGLMCAPQDENPVRSNFSPNEFISEAMAHHRRSPSGSSLSSDGSSSTYLDYRPIDPPPTECPPVHASFVGSASVNFLTPLPSLFSLSSLPSLFSLSPLSSIASLTDSEDDVEPSAKEGVPHCSTIPEAQNIPASTSGKRRRRNPEKEAERRAKRQKVNPRKRKGTRKERLDRGKVKYAEKQAVHSNKEYDNFNRSRSVSKHGSHPEEGAPNKQHQSFDGSKSLSNQAVFTLADMKSRGFEVIEWDGM